MKLKCDRCKFLKPTEEEQTNNKESHMCILSDRPLLHMHMHPQLPRPYWCQLNKQEAT